MGTQVHSTKYFKKTTYYLSFSNYSKKKLREKNTSKLIFRGQYYPETKTKETTKKRVLKANNPDKHRCNNSQ